MIISRYRNKFPAINVVFNQVLYSFLMHHQMKMQSGIHSFMNFFTYIHIYRDDNNATFLMPHILYTCKIYLFLYPLALVVVGLLKLLWLGHFNGKERLISRIRYHSIYQYIMLVQVFHYICSNRSPRAINSYHCYII